MKYQEKCECCESVLTAYTHSINVPLVKALRQLVDFYEKQKSPANLQKDLSLTKNQYNNFQKLQYFDLVVRTPKGWFPTQYGMNFIAGTVFVPNFVATLGSKVIEKGHPAWKTHKKTQEFINVKDIDSDSYKHREEYQAEKSQQLNLI